ncbi:hypothetical protein CEXT_797161 [Caerostris extrusa]|uniref:Uncharacterized protein n=1 Tax=Caerostris extrusa TaxID=172846 RepID=A0AAV4P8N9_CAEEX|nr:hypothetical protein CEXT_797161 [Caerostris extrusa]
MAGIPCSLLYVSDTMDRHLSVKNVNDRAEIPFIARKTVKKVETNATQEQESSELRFHEICFLEETVWLGRSCFLLFESCNGTRSEGEGENINGGSDGRAECFLVEPEWTHGSATVQLRETLAL